jgi:toxin ParE1/3/4
MARIIISPTAEADAAEIWAYIARDNPPAASRILGRFDQLFRTLAGQPGTGKSVEMLAPNLRFIPMGSYLVFYRTLPDGVEISRILHGARDITAELFRE